MMRFDIVTIFPAMVEQALGAGIVGRAIERGTLDVTVHDLRAFTTDRHRVVDDVPYGGGPGMVLKPEPMFGRSMRSRATASAAATVILTSPQGTRFTQEVAQRLSRLPRLALLCGRYEGVDERVRSRVDEEISIGDYVLSGGELAALVIVDAVARLIPGVVGDEQSVVDDSFSRGLLDFPQYTRPAELTMRGPGSAEREPLEGAGRAAVGQSRGDSAMAQARSRRAHAGAAAGSADGRDARRRGTGNFARARRGAREAIARVTRDPPDEGVMDMGAMEVVEKSQLAERPAMRSGDTVRVHVKVREGDKERIQIFEGVVIGLHRGGTRASFTVRKVSFGQGVERIFPLHSPTIQKVEVMRSAKVRRAKLYYLRDLKGKAARMKDSGKPQGR